MTFTQLGLAALVITMAILYILADRRRTIAVCAFDGGKVRVIQGRLSARVLNEVRDVAERNRLNGKLVIRREDRAIRLDMTGIDDARAAQQLRNVLGRFRLPELTS